MLPFSINTYLPQRPHDFLGGGGAKIKVVNKEEIGMELNGASIYQGDTIYVRFELEDYEDMTDSHPLKASGLQTPGYVSVLVVKRKCFPYEQPVLDVTLTPLSQTLAGIELIDEMLDVAVGSKPVELSYRVEVKADDDSGRRYTVDQGVFAIV